MEEKEKYSGLAVVVIDVQPPYLGKLDTETRAALIRSQLEVVSFYGNRNVPVIGVEMEKQGKTSLILRRYFKNGLVKKNFSDGFFCTGLEDKLREKQCTDLVMMGLFRSECVYDTAGSASHLGFNVYAANSLIADNPKRVYRVTDDELRSICSLSADNRELFSVVEMRRKDKKD